MNYTQHISTGVKNSKGREILVSIQNLEEGTMVAVRPLITSLGLHWETQSKKIQTDPRFNCTVKRIVARDGKCRDMLCLPSEQIPTLFNSICSSRVRADKKEAVLALQVFFSEALNSIVRGDYVTSDMVNSIVIEAVRREMAPFIKENLVLKERNQYLESASKKRATANSMGMHARKDEIKAGNVINMFSKAN